MDIIIEHHFRTLSLLQYRGSCTLCVFYGYNICKNLPLWKKETVKLFLWLYWRCFIHFKASMKFTHFIFVDSHAVDLLTVVTKIFLTAAHFWPYFNVHMSTVFEVIEKCLQKVLIFRNETILGGRAEKTALVMPTKNIWMKKTVSVFFSVWMIYDQEHFLFFIFWLFLLLTHLQFTRDKKRV